MITFKEFLAEEAVYYGDYNTLRTSRSAIKSFQREISETFGIPTARIKIIPHLVDNKPTFRFKFDVALTKKDDPVLVGKMLQDFAKKDLENDYPKVTVYSDVSPWQGRDGKTRVLFSLRTHGDQTK
jgi:hypothetical protein